MSPTSVKVVGVEYCRMGPAEGRSRSEIGKGAERTDATGLHKHKMLE